ncbi:CD5 antigen-like isoform 2-T2 [Discoglossus pictus]
MRTLTFLLIGSLFGFVISESMKVRLADGKTQCSGRLEVFYSDQWGTVCDDEWDILDSKVVCKQLECGPPKLAYDCGKSTKQVGPIWLDDVNCTGREKSLSQCKANAPGVHNCNHKEDVGIQCKDPFQLRLVDGPNICTGRLEVFNEGEWGSVCDDHWDKKDAMVVCRQLGCESAQPYKARRRRFGQGNGRIWLDDVHCNGNEKSLANCKHRMWGYNDCTHKEDVSVYCSGKAAVSQNDKGLIQKK